ncbi:hypothetical protein Tco_1011435, partial [Tanacetum coccineum]
MTGWRSTNGYYATRPRECNRRKLARAKRTPSLIAQGASNSLQLSILDIKYDLGYVQIFWVVILQVALKKKRYSKEARIAKEVEANQKRIKKDLEKQHVLRRK